MLIGPTITLAELEKHMEVQGSKNSQEITKLAQELNLLNDKYQTTPKYKKDENGKQVVNPEYEKTLNEFQEKENRYEELIKSTEFIKEKLNEIDDLEYNSNGQFNKEKEKITLTLDDCVLLGVTTEEE